MSNRLFKLTIALIVLFIIAVGYYFYIWISFEPYDALGGDKEQVAYIKSLPIKRVVSNI